MNMVVPFLRGSAAIAGYIEPWDESFSVVIGSTTLGSSTRCSVRASFLDNERGSDRLERAPRADVRASSARGWPWHHVPVTERRSGIALHAAWSLPSQQAGRRVRARLARRRATFARR